MHSQITYARGSNSICGGLPAKPNQESHLAVQRRPRSNSEMSANLCKGMSEDESAQKDGRSERSGNLVRPVYPGYTRVYPGVPEYTRVCPGIPGYTLVCPGVTGYTRVEYMLWRAHSSLPPRTLSRADLRGLRICFCKCMLLGRHPTSTCEHGRTSASVSRADCCTTCTTCRTVRTCRTGSARGRCGPPIAESRTENRNPDLRSAKGQARRW